MNGQTQNQSPIRIWSWLHFRQAQILANRCNMQAKVRDLKGNENRFKDFEAMEELNYGIEVKKQKPSSATEQTLKLKTVPCLPEVFCKTKIITWMLQDYELIEET